MTHTPPARTASRLQSLVLFFSDREYYASLLTIALPIALQQFITSSLNLVGVTMIGQLGDVMVAGVGLAGQIFFLLMLTLFGITSGSAMFTAQMWGKGDLANIRRVLGLGLIFCLAAAAVFATAALAVPERVIGLYTTDPAVIQVAARFLRIFGWSYPFLAITFMFAAVRRSTGDVRGPLVVSVSALALNSLLAYVLIFGKLGMPALGVEGAAIAGLLARLLECAAMVATTYLRKSPVALRLHDLRGLSWAFAGRVLLPVLPVAANELLWSFGVTSYNAIYAHLSTGAVAAMNIASSIDGLGVVVFLGIGNATAILVGNRIGAGKLGEAQRYALRSLLLAMFSALFVGVLVWLGKDLILGLYRVSAEVLDSVRRVLGVMALLYWLRAANIVLFLGILRAGGDTRFGLLLDAGIIWVLGVPLAYLGAFVFHLPVHLVYLLVYSEEITKMLLALWRFASRRWIHNLAGAV